ncbi:MAG: hypothetical protein GXP33_00570 [Spirochaetes bacterium]|nr:hypothetical protein [Spirochaetota bacterium]
MKHKHLIQVAIMIGSLLISPCIVYAQDSLASSSTWFAKALRNWFPENIEIHSSKYPITRIRSSSVDLTHFKAKAGITNIGLGPAFHIEGSLTLDSLPSGLKVFDGAQGKKYLLQLQGYLFSPEGKLLWSQKGYPTGNSWVHVSGSTTNFHIINRFKGSLNACTAVILAVGVPILVKGSSETHVILGMKRFNFQNNLESTDYKPLKTQKLHQKKVSQKSSVQKTTPIKKINFGEPKYIQKKLYGWKYTEVVNIPVATRKKIFRDVVRYQDRTGDDSGADKAIAKKYGLPERAVIAISSEGVLKNWPMP